MILYIFLKKINNKTLYSRVYNNFLKNILKLERNLNKIIYN